MDKKLPAETMEMIRSMGESPKTVKQLHEACGISKNTIYKFLRKALGEENVDFTLHGTSSGGRPPKYWSLTERGKMLMLQVKTGTT